MHRYMRSIPAASTTFVHFSTSATMRALNSLGLQGLGSLPSALKCAASLALLGRTDEARQVIARLLEHAPGYTVSEVRRHQEFDMNSRFKRPGVTESLYRGLRLAGLPE